MVITNERDMEKTLANMTVKERALAIWGKPINGVWCQEISTLQANSGWYAYGLCPSCQKQLTNSHFVRKEYDPSGEELWAWHYKCDCNAKIQIFND